MLLNSKRHIDQCRAEVHMIKFTVNNTPCLPKHKSAIILFYYMYIINVCYVFPAIFKPLKPLTLGLIIRNCLTF